jgi:RNA polymerase sigma factor (sigma-70 family)
MEGRMEDGGMEAAVALAPAPVRAATLQSDTELVAAVRRGDDRAFEELYARYHRRISSYIFGMVKDHARAEDLTQEVFMSALRRMRDTDRPIAFKPWIYEIAKNACIDQFRRSKRAEEVSYDAEEGMGAADYGRLTSSDATPDVAMERRQDLDHLRGALGGLSEAHHQILVMREFEGLSYREIGERMGMSRPSVESTLFRARKRLSEEYDELVSGQRCVRVQGIIAGASGGGLGARDRRRMARHLSYCQACRRHAYSAGLGDVIPAKTGVGAKIAAWLPMPFFLQKRLLGLRGSGGSDGSHAGALAHWSASASQFEPAAAGWTKAVATAATLAVAGVGAGAVTSQRHDVANAVGPAGLSSLGHDSATSSAPVAARPAGGLATTVAASPTRGATRTTPSRGTSTTSTTPGATKTTPGGPATQAAGGAGATQQAAAGAAKPKASGSGGDANPIEKTVQAVTGSGSGDQSTGGGGSTSAQLPAVTVPTSTPTVPSDVTTVPTDVTKSLGGGGGDKSAGDVGKTVGDAVGSLTGG